MEPWKGRRRGSLVCPLRGPWEAAWSRERTCSGTGVSKEQLSHQNYSPGAPLLSAFQLPSSPWKPGQAWTLFPYTRTLAESFLPGEHQPLRSPERERDIPVRVKRAWADHSRDRKWSDKGSHTRRQSCIIVCQYMHFKTQSPGIPSSQGDEKESFSMKAFYILKKAHRCFPRTEQEHRVPRAMWHDMSLIPSPSTVGGVFRFLSCVTSSSAAPKGRAGGLTVSIWLRERAAS